MTIAKLTNAIASKLNRSNRAAQLANLGSWIQNAPISGSHAVTSGQASASAIVIQTNLTTVRGKMVNVYRSGSPVSGSAIKVTSSGSNLNITSISGNWVIAASDEVDYIVF